MYKRQGRVVIKISGVSYRKDSLVEKLWGLKKPNKKGKRKKWKEFEKKVKELTEMQPLHLMKDFDKRGWKNFHVDHILSIKYCWRNSISEYDCSNINNLQMLKSEENISKSDSGYCVLEQCEHLRKL